MTFESILTWLDPLYAQADRLPLAYAMGAGVLASINPCGFVMLPTYAALFVRGAGGEARTPVSRQVRRALVAGLAMTAGFVLLFGVLGAIFSSGGRAITEYFPYTALVVGVLLIGAGLAIVLGRAVPEMRVPGLTLSDTGSVRGMFLYGVAYGVASLGCALPIFLVVVGAATASSSWLTSLVQFLNFALGMGIVVTIVSVAIALSREGVVRLIRRSFRYSAQVTAIFLLLGGTYLIAYWYYVARDLA